MKFLTEVCQHSEVNKMAESNIGIVFGPTLMRNKEESLSGMMNPMNNPAGTIAALVKNFNDIFGEDPPEFNETPQVNETSDQVEKKTVPLIKPRRTSNPISTPQQLGSSKSTSSIKVKQLAELKNMGNKNSPIKSTRSQTVGTKPNIPMLAARSNSKSEIIKPPIAPKPSIPKKPDLSELQKAPPIPEKPVIPPKPTIPEEPKPSLPPKPKLPPKPEPTAELATAIAES